MPNELTPAELDAIRNDVHNGTPNRPTTVEANGRATIYWQHCRDLLAHIDALTAKAARLEGDLQEVKDDFDVYRNSGGYGL